MPNNATQAKSVKTMRVLSKHWFLLEVRNFPHSLHKDCSLRGSIHILRLQSSRLCASQLRNSKKGIVLQRTESYLLNKQAGILTGFDCITQVFESEILVDNGVSI